MRKLKFVKAKLKEWNRGLFGDLRDLQIDESRSLHFESLKKEGARGFIVKGKGLLEAKI